MNETKTEKLRRWQEKLQRYDAAWAEEYARMDEREEIYRGRDCIDPLVEGDVIRKTPHVRNIAAELIEAQVDPNIPQPKVTALRAQDEGLAALIEDMLRDKLESLDMELINDQLNQTNAAQARQAFEDALALWQAYGYVTEPIAGTLNLPVGTAYSEQAYNEWYQAYQEAANGVYTGQRTEDTVNAPPETGEEGEKPNPAAGDSPQNHASVRRGSTGADVTAMQTYLLALGYHCGDKGADGVFGADTCSAVRAFQQDYGLKVDGVCGPKTWAALIAALGG